MRVPDFGVSEQQLLFLFYGMVMGKSLLNSFAKLVCKIVGIDIASFQFLIICIEDLQDILTDKLIVSIHYQDYGILAADVEDSIVYIFHGCLVFVIFNVRVPFLWNVVEVEVLSVGKVTAVVGSIVDNNSEVIRVILAENGIEVVLYSKIDVVVVRTSKYADRKLLLVSIELINIVQAIVLC